MIHIFMIKHKCIIICLKKIILIRKNQYKKKLFYKINQINQISILVNILK